MHIRYVKYLETKDHFYEHIFMDYVIPDFSQLQEHFRSDSWKNLIHT